MEKLRLGIGSFFWKIFFYVRTVAIVDEADEHFTKSNFLRLWADIYAALSTP